MSRRTARLVLATAACAIAPVASTFALTSAATAQPAGYGPSSPFIEALLPSHGPVEPMKNQSKIIRTGDGYRLTSGQQNNRITVTVGDGKIRFRDTKTQSWKSMPSTCSKISVKRGIAAVCKVPSGTSAGNPTLLEIHPRLGNDFVDGRTLPASLELAVLCDRGRDTVYAGAGDDFINGAQDPDVVRGGAGNDWIRGGTGNDRLWGGQGNDYMVGADGRDQVGGGAGVNRVYNKN